MIGTFNTSNHHTSMGLGSVRLDRVDMNISLSNQQQLSAPMRVNVSTSKSIQKVGFFSLVVIMEMISLNLQIETFKLNETKGQIGLGYYSGLSEVEFYLSSGSMESYRRVSLSTQYNLTLQTINYTVNSSSSSGAGGTITYVVGPFYEDKIVNYTRGVGLNVKLNTLKDYHYLRCIQQNKTLFSQVKKFTQGKYYKLVPFQNTSLVMDIDANGTLLLSTPSNNASSQLFYINSLGSNSYRFSSVQTNTPLMYNRTSSQPYYPKYGWPMNVSYVNDTLWNVVYSINADSMQYVMMTVQGMYLSVENVTAVQNSRVILGNISNNSTVVNDTFRWILVEAQNPTIPTNTTTTTQINQPLIQGSNKAYFIDRSEFVNITYNASLLGYGYFSMPDFRCYSSYSSYNWLTIGNERIMYYFDTASTLATSVIELHSNQAMINTSSVQFALGHTYGVMINRSSLSNYLYDLSKGFSNRFYVNDNSNNNQYQLYISYYQDISNVSNTSNVNSSSSQLIVKLSNGCSQMRVFQYGGYECQKCANNYVIYQSLVSTNNNNNNYHNNSNSSSMSDQLLFNSVTVTVNEQQLPHQCYCPAGQFMTQSGQCRACSGHELKCLPPITISAQIDWSLTASSQSQQSTSISIKVSIENTPQIKFSLMTPIYKVMSSMAVVINNKEYLLTLSQVKSCISEQTSFCITFSVTNVTKSDYYHVRLAVVEGGWSASNGSTADSSSEGYMLVNQQAQSVASSAVVRYLIENIEPLRTLLQIAGVIDGGYLSSTSSSQSQSLQQSSIYFVKLQSHPIVISDQSTMQTMAQSIQPALSTLNSSSQIILLAAPFLFGKFNLFSILQTNSILYMISFFKFPYQNNSNITSSIPYVVREMFIFRNQPIFKVFYLKPKGDENGSVESVGWIGIDSYGSQFEKDFLFNSTAYGELSYPLGLYSVAIPSLNISQQSQNYLTLTLNSLSLIILQIILMQLFIKLVSKICSSSQQTKTHQGKEILIKKRIIIDLKRHHSVGGIANGEDVMCKNSQGDKLSLTRLLEDNILLTEKRIQWQEMPKLKNCIKSTLLQEQQIKTQSPNQQQVNSQTKQTKTSSSIIQSSQNKNTTNTQNQLQPQLQLRQNQQSEQKQKQKLKDTGYEATIKQRLLFFAQGMRQKRKILYSSCVMIQIISQSFLLYFELIKPFDTSSSTMSTSTVLLHFIDMCFGLTVMFLIIVFPVFLINYYPLHLLKIVQVSCKLGAYQMEAQTKDGDNSNDQPNVSEKYNNFLKHSYSYGEIYFHFCIIYYEIILIPFAVAIGNDIFWQSLPIALYQLFKLIWLYKRLKVLDKLKIVSMFLVFSVIAVWNFMPYNTTTQSIFQKIIIWNLYFILFIQAAKLLKFVIVSVMNLLKTKRQQYLANDLISDNKIVTETQLSRKTMKLVKQVQIESLQEYISPLNTEKILLDSKKQRHKTAKVRFREDLSQKQEQLQSEKVQKSLTYNNKQGETSIRRRIISHRKNISSKMNQNQIHEQPTQGIAVRFNFSKKRQQPLE